MKEEKQHKIELNRGKPSPEEIAGYKDFNEVLAGHKKLTKRPGFGQKRILYLLILIAFLLAMLLFLDKTEKQEQQHKTEKTATP